MNGKEKKLQKEEKMLSGTAVHCITHCKEREEKERERERERE